MNQDAITFRGVNMKVLDWTLSSGILAAVLMFGFVLGFFGSIWAISEPIYCGNKPCAEAMK